MVTINQVLDDIISMIDSVERDENDEIPEGVVEAAIGSIRGYVQGVRWAIPTDDQPDTEADSDDA